MNPAVSFSSSSAISGANIIRHDVQKPCVKPKIAKMVNGNQTESITGISLLSAKSMKKVYRPNLKKINTQVDFTEYIDLMFPQYLPKVSQQLKVKTNRVDFQLKVKSYI